MLPIEWQYFALLGQLVASIATVVIAILVFLTTRRIARLEEHRYLTDQWQAFNRLGIESDNLPEVSRALYGHDHDDLEIRKNHYRGTMQNMAYSYYLAKREGYLDQPVADGYLDYFASRLKPLHEDMQHLEQLYGAEFANAIQERMNKTEK